uniref:NADH dehydrogenase subunit 5 n=1 Tax=Tachaea chinensis TaxID=1862870 RepID=UPI000EF2FB2A|nr:NADH dehydrogenase subunit 5 [Tachaea chinensis]ATO58515.1 NADH dehydrogenase subunit 5 [Tachaea chinensis]
MLKKPPFTKITSTILLTISTFSIITTFYLILTNLSFMMEFEILSLKSSSFYLTILIDWMSMFFFSFILIISSSVITFSSMYMYHDELIKRFIILILLFILSMCCLVFSLNLISILIGWDGLGITSFILVAYYQNNKSNAASLITALTNRIGDSLIILSIALFMFNSSWNFMLSPMSNNLLMFLIILAAMTKSAQMPFSAWLPASMAAPTPVSALVHSSTLVTAGIYLMIRFNPMIMNSKLHTFILLIGLLTCFMASLSACFETDLKKTIALSTLSQLGIMTATLSLGLPSLAFFHLMTHATFKSLLFLAAGKIINEVNHSQDFRSMGSLLFNLPYTSTILNTTNMALSGIPFLSGFYSKHLLFNSYLMNDISFTILSLFFLAIGLTSSYSMRLTLSSIINDNMKSPLSKSSEDLTSLMSMMLLLSLSVTSGSFISWMIILNPPFSISHTFLSLSSTLLLLLGILLGFILSTKHSSPQYLSYHKMFMNMWFLPYISSKFMLKPTLLLSSNFKIMEHGWTEYLEGQGSWKSAMNLSFILTKFQIHSIKTFILIMWLITMMTILL